MRSHLERLKYSTLAPSRYLVYMHPVEYARLEGIIPILQGETIRALAEEVSRLNRRSALRRYTERILGDAAPLVQSASGEWQVEFLSDPDGVVAEDDILVDSELLLPAAPELGVGESTRRITTLRSGSADDQLEKPLLKRPARRQPARSPESCTRTARVITPTMSSRTLSPSAAAASRIRSTSGSCHRWMCPENTRASGAMRRPAVFSDRLELSWDHPERSPRSAGVCGRERHQEGKRRGNGAPGSGAYRSGRNGLPRFQRGAPMTALLWARLVMLAALGLVVALYALVEREPDSIWRRASAARRAFPYRYPALASGYTDAGSSARSTRTAFTLTPNAASSS